MLREAVAFGYDKYAKGYIEWLDRCLLSDANPPHWVRTPGRGERTPGFRRRKVGDTEETGNRENDGHGICMWGRYMAWHWWGRDREWNLRHWPATRAAADWIVWQLDTQPLFPGKVRDVLYTESECAKGAFDIYSSYNCLHGLKLSIRMAEALAMTDDAKRWRDAHARLRRGILTELTQDTADGKVWHTEANCDWQDHAHKLVHIHLATEGDSYTPLDDYAAGDEMEREYLAITRNSYAYLMKSGNYDCLRMYGYGQGMMLQAALLLDQMTDAERFLDLMTAYGYLPNMEGWICPEGIIVHRDRKLYVPVNGYMGQDSHVADSTKAVRVMLGIDDNDPHQLRLVPRFPASWNEARVRDFPVLTGAGRQRMSYRYHRHPDRQEFDVSFDREVESVRVRLGPLPDGAGIAGAECEGAACPVRGTRSGDGHWAWVDLPGSIRSGRVVLRLKHS